MIPIALIASAIDFGVEEAPKVIAAIQRLRELKPDNVTTEEWLDQLAHPSVAQSLDVYLRQAGARPVVHAAAVEVENRQDGSRTPAQIADLINLAISQNSPVTRAMFGTDFEWGIAQGLLHGKS